MAERICVLLEFLDQLHLLLIVDCKLVLAPYSATGSLILHDLAILRNRSRLPLNFLTHLRLRNYLHTVDFLRYLDAVFRVRWQTGLRH